jgi:polyvinyl alcohol dehydrogenase (cytochrome)
MKRKISAGLVIAAASVAIALVNTLGASSATPPPSWPTAGHDLSDTRSNPDESAIGPENVSRLATKWTFTTHGDVSATATVVGGALYFPDWGGYVYKLDAATGTTIWSHKVSEYTGIPGDVARTSPAVAGDTVYIGDQIGAHLIALDAATGDARWVTALDEHFASALTQSPIVYDGVVYEGVSSNEEAFSALIPNYACCSFRGSMTAVSAATGTILWKTRMAPLGYSGAAVWNGTPAIDPETGTLYVATGNNYSVPAEAQTCQDNGGTASECLSPDNHIDALVAFDMHTGGIRWSTGVTGFDNWNAGCIAGFGFPGNCPVDAGPDADFGSGVNLFTIKTRGRVRKMVGAGQKSGQYWALDAGTGQIVWSTAVAPGSSLGGIEWGTATDGKRIYVAESNFDHLPYTLPNGTTIRSGSWAALDPDTGKILWQVADPSGSFDIGPLSTANGVVYAPSMSGNMYALSAGSGDILWSKQGPGSSNAGAAIVDGTVYWGNGYSRLPFPGFNPSTTFYAFSIRGR